LRQDKHQDRGGCEAQDDKAFSVREERASSVLDVGSLPGDCERQESRGSNTAGAHESSEVSGATRMAGEGAHG
jgi:hypothetical protein